MNEGDTDFQIERYLDALLEVSLVLTEEREPSRVAQAVLRRVAKIFDAERAALFLCQKSEDFFSDALFWTAQASDEKSLKIMNRSLVDKVRQKRTSFLASGRDDASAVVAESGSPANLRSIVASPVTFKERMYGVVYLDKRMSRNSFDSEDLKILSAVAKHVAVKLETAKQFAEIQDTTQELTHLVNEGRTISSCESMANLSKILKNAFSTTVGKFVDAHVYFSSSCFFTDRAGEGFYQLDDYGLIKEETRIVGNEFETASGFWLCVEEPRSKELLALVHIETYDGQENERNLSILQALSNNAANAISAIRLQSAMTLLEEKTSEIRTIFATITQGICTVDHNMTIGTEHSKYCETIFGSSNLENQNLTDLFFKDSNLSEDAVAQIEGVVSTSIGSPTALFEASVECLPHELSRRKSDVPSFYELDWASIADENDDVTQIMLVIRDVTELKKLRAANLKRKEEIGVIEEVLAVPQRQFMQLTAEVSRVILSVKGFAQNRKDFPPEEMNSLKRDMHTLKGNCKILGFSTLSAAIYLLENHVFAAALPENDSPESSYALSEAIERTRTTLLDHLEFNERLLQRAEIARAEKNQVKMQELLAPLQKSAARIATELGKPAPEFILQIENVYVESHFSATLFSIFSHLIHNSIAHGLSSHSIGEIHIRVKPDSGSWTTRIEYFDNGKGLHLTRLHEKGIADGSLTSESTDMEIARTVFGFEVSTADKVTEFSGRGVGLSAVTEMVKSVNGKIELNLEQSGDQFDFCRFSFVFEFDENLIAVAK